LATWKPTQKNRNGEILEDLSGSESMACIERSPGNLGGPVAPAKLVGTSETKVRMSTCLRKSDQLIVLRGRESRLHGKGASRDT